ncbi:40S ribosomal protein S30 [Vitis vinifera]|uniref:40S ribosomal protein S30 n=1 Tax=Vitis vinifera TaxID=29760 RepID=A0A438K730_VITVI|nr:40S ribosomal protein S30 [Vitis vinifera]
MGKVHGSLARAGKVRGQTPKVAKQDKKKKPRGRAHKRMQYNRRFVTAVYWEMAFFPNKNTILFSGSTWFNL